MNPTAAMSPPSLELRTERLCLRQWRETERSAFADLHADPDAMADLGGPLDRTGADRKFDQYLASWQRHGYGKWAIFAHDRFLGYVGVMATHDMAPLQPHNEMGWRLHKWAWGHGYATEAAHAALTDVFHRCNLQEVLAYTGPTNIRSQAVMQRLNLVRDPSRDFAIPDEKLGQWHGCVWVARRCDFQEKK